jgi:hypothetical protein
MNTEVMQKPITYERADANCRVPDKTESVAPSSEPDWPKYC